MTLKEVEPLDKKEAVSHGFLSSYRGSSVSTEAMMERIYEDTIAGFRLGPQF